MRFPSQAYYLKLQTLESIRELFPKTLTHSNFYTILFLPIDIILMIMRNKIISEKKKFLYIPILQTLHAALVMTDAKSFLPRIRGSYLQFVMRYSAI